MMTPQERAADDYEKRQKAIAKKWDAKMTPEQREFRLKYEARKKAQDDEQKRLNPFDASDASQRFLMTGARMAEADTPVVCCSRL